MAQNNTRQVKLRAGALFIIGCLIAMPLGAVQSQGKPSDTLAKLVVKAIDEKYLYAHSSEWPKIRQTIASINDSPAGDAVRVRKALARLRDSELHLVTPEEVAAILDESAGRKMGSGLMEASIDLVPKTGDTRIVTPLVGSPAALAGLLPKDLIVKINGNKTRDLDHEQVLDELRTHPQSTLVVRRGLHTFTVRLFFSNAPLQAVSGRLLTVGIHHVGYLRIAQFTPDAAEAFRSAIITLQSQGAAAYVIDVRNNPGGFLGAATEITGLFVSGHLGDKVAQDGSAEPIHSDAPPLINAETKIAILINEGTASASELFACSMQDRKRAALIGAPTFGRGQAQTFLPLPDHYGLVLPVVLLRTPSGRTYKGTGLTPDIRVASKSMVDAEVNPGNDPQLRRALTVVTERTGSQ